MTITRKQLEKFVATRNKSGHDSNLQWQIDADACGFDPKDLGDPRKFTWDGFTGYEWRVRLKGVTGPTIMVEFGRRVYLAGGTVEDQAALMEILSKATFQPVLTECNAEVQAQFARAIG